MKISHNWLSEYIELTSEWTPAHIAQTLTDLGLEVEHIEDRGSTLKGFVVGHILTCEKHPKADKLSVTTVDVGDGVVRTIVCGASNVAAGQIVPVALEGAVVPTGGGYTIARRVLRGVESQGMICSKAELGLEADVVGIWAMDAGVVGTPLADVLGFTDIVYDVAITPNRADALSHIGIARDLQAYMHVHEGRRALQPNIATTATSTLQSNVRVDVKDTALCPRYIAQRITGVRVQPSPQWMQDRLAAIGLRPRNIIVDATNYVMMEYGQPLHAFDARALNGHIIVQTAADAYAGKPRPWMFTTLDGKQRELDADVLLICNADGPVGIAGVMGGENSEIADDTTDIVIESAYFAPSSIRWTAKRVGLNTDASYRFERGVDIEAVAAACARATALICQYAGGVATATPIAADAPVAHAPVAHAPVDIYPTPFAQREVRVRYDRMRSINGIDVSNATIDTMCEAVGLTRVNANVWNVPSHRSDIQDEIDVAEEVMRLYGVNNIPSATHAHIAFGVAVHAPHDAVANAVRKGLVARGYADCVTHVLGAPPEGDATPETREATSHNSTVTLKNAMGVEFSALRSSLVPSLLRVASANLRHGAQGVRLVEIGKVFTRSADGEFGLKETQMVCVLACGLTEMHWSGKQKEIDIYDLEGDVLAALRLAGVDVSLTPGAGGAVAPIHDRTLKVKGDATDASQSLSMYVETNSVAVMHEGVVVGRIAGLHPAFAKKYDIERPVVVAEIDVRALVPQIREYRNVGMFPSVRRDVAFVVEDGVAAGTIMDVARRSGTTLLTDVDVFDVYRDDQLGGDKKSVGLSLTFRSDERTLVDAEVDAAVSSIVNAASSELHAQVRGN